MKGITYNGGYRYQLKHPCQVTLDFTPPVPIHTEYTTFAASPLNAAQGVLTIQKGYAWDGPSGPTIDTPSFMRGSLVHDALYQLMREGHLDPKVYRLKADQALRTICQQDKMWSVRAWWVYWGVRLFGNHAADPAHGHKPMVAPRHYHWWKKTASLLHLGRARTAAHG